MIDTNGNVFEIPDFTIKQIRDAIPAHCFHRSTARSLGYVARDLTVLATVFYLFNKFCTPDYVPFLGARVVLWSLYTVIQGIQATGLWVLAHECGHGGFSDHRLLNDVVGWICHSALLVPYFSWKISHGKHHKATAHMERDMVFVPKSRAVYAQKVGRTVHELAELAEETPIVSALELLGQQLFGWPMYLVTNATGHNCHERQPEGRGRGKENGLKDGVNHFNPESPLYEARDAKYILLSDLGLALAGTALYLLVQKFGFVNMLVWYFLPYLWVNHWLGKFPPSTLSTTVNHKPLLTRCASGHHLPPAHGPGAAALRARGVELRARRRGHGGPRLRLRGAALLPRHHRDARAAPLRQFHPLLPRRRGHGGHPARHGPPLPLGHGRGAPGLLPRALAQLPHVQLGRADRGRRGRGPQRAVLPQPQRAGAAAGPVLSRGPPGMALREDKRPVVRRRPQTKRSVLLIDPFLGKSSRPLPLECPGVLCAHSIPGLSFKPLSEHQQKAHEVH